MEDAPGGVVAEDAAGLALVGGGAQAEAGAELGGEGTEALVADVVADVGDGAAGDEEVAGAVEAQASEEVVGGFAEGGAEEAMEVEVRETGLAGGVLEKDAGVVLGGEEVPGAAEAAEGVVVNELA